MMPTIQIRIVLVTSQMLLAMALTYLVTETPHTLKVVIENTPKVPDIIRTAEEVID